MTIMKKAGRSSPLDGTGNLPVIGKGTGHGTKIRFLPDGEIFEKTRFKEDEIKSRMKEDCVPEPGAYDLLPGF